MMSSIRLKVYTVLLLELLPVAFECVLGFLLWEVKVWWRQGNCGTSHLLGSFFCWSSLLFVLLHSYCRL